MRHAVAPGNGDPAEFRLGDCATQRNLSNEDRAQAKEMGAQLRRHGITAATVFSSQWCRCRETAGSLGSGAAQELPALNSFYEIRQRKGVQTQQLTEWMDNQSLSQPLILVRHQVNLTALSNMYPSSGELVAMAREPDSGNLYVVGSALRAG